MFRFLKDLDKKINVFQLVEEVVEAPVKVLDAVLDLDIVGNLMKRNFKPYTGNDWRDRTCEITVYSRPFSDSGIVDHWCLNFDWGDYEATYEANDTDGFLIPRWNIGPPDSRFNWTARERHRITTSPGDVHQKAKNLPMNGERYRLTSKNCQYWVIDLAKEWGKEIKMPAARRRCLFNCWVSGKYCVQRGQPFCKVIWFF